MYCSLSCKSGACVDALSLAGYLPSTATCTGAGASEALLEIVLSFFISTSIFISISIDSSSKLYTCYLIKIIIIACSYTMLIVSVYTIYT